MGLSVNIVPYSGGPQTFDITFALGFLEREHVTVNVIGEVDGSGDPIFRAFTWNSDSEILVTDTLPNPCQVRIARSLPRDTLLVDYTADGSITREALDRSSRQTIMLAHEALDGRLADGQDLETSLASAEAFADAAAASATEASTAAVTAGARLFNSKSAMLSSTQGATGIGNIWRARGKLWEEASPGASDHHETTAGPVKLYEAGFRFTSEARFVQAVARGNTYDQFDLVQAGDSTYVFLDDGNTDIAGLTGWAYQIIDGGTF